MSASPVRTGQQWGEQNVVAAAAAAGVLAPHQSELRLKRFEVDGGVVLIWDDRAERTKIIWGPVKDDTPGEAKLQALLNVHAEHGSLDGLEVDIRAPDSPVVRPIKRP